MRTTDYALNRLRVLKAIRRHGPIARTDLPGQTGLSSGSITQLTAEFLRLGLIVERKDTTSRRGRPRTHLEIDSANAVVVGASLSGAGRLGASFVDLLGNRLHSVEVRLGPQPSLIAMAMAIAGALHTAILQGSSAQKPVRRVGIAMPALVDSENGNVHFMTTFPPAGPVPFASIIANQLGLPVTIENDVSCMARSEHWFGRAQDLATFTLIHLGFAIGSAEYVDGSPKYGANGLNPEFGHVKSVTGSDRRPCLCGGFGCLATYASIYGILQATGDLHDAPFPPTRSLEQRFEHFLARARAGDASALTALEQAGTHLGTALGNYINASAPGTVLLSFATPDFYPAIAEPMQRALTQSAIPGALPVTKIEILVDQNDWRWQGTAALALEQTYLAG